MRAFKGRSITVSCLGIVFAASIEVSAQSIYDNFDASDGYTTMPGGTLSIGAPIYAHNRYAVPFTAAVTTPLASVELAVSLEGGPNELDVWLMSDANGPHSVIEAFHLSGAMPQYPSANAPISAVSSLHPVLTAGTRYWLAAGVSGPDALAHWQLNSTGDSGDVAYWTFSDPWGIYANELRGAFRVNGSSPAPAKLWVGLKNSDDQGTQFDVWTALYLNEVLVAEGRTLCITGITRNASKAREISVPFEPVITSPLVSGDALSLKVSVRIGTDPDGSKCAGHSNARGLRLYYDADSRPSRFGVAISPSPMTEHFLHSTGAEDFFDSVAPVQSTAKQKDSGPVNFAGGNPWVPVGTWILTVP